MSRLIDADALEKDGWMMHRTVQVDKNTMSYETKKPTDFPTIEPDRKGKWIEDGYSHYKAVCDQCGEPCATYANGLPRDRFCKWCGARMKGAEQE